nr:GntR family transcriptional regulator [Anaerobacillus sp. CMMVII]
METKYSMVKQNLKSKILDGTFTSQQRISSENELMKEFEVSRHTIRMAIGELVSEGWLYREQGAGTFVADRLNEEPRYEKKSKILQLSQRIFLIIFFHQSFVAQNHI